MKSYKTYYCNICGERCKTFESFEQHSNGFLEQVFDVECPNGCEFKPGFDITEDYEDNV